jgi:hypothetical protein
MRHFTTDSPEVVRPEIGPSADGGYPIDGDLHQMTDDGCPLNPDPARWVDPADKDKIRARLQAALNPDPARWVDPDWRDSPGGPDAPAPAPMNSRWQRLREQAAVRERWRTAALGV